MAANEMGGAERALCEPLYPESGAPVRGFRCGECGAVTRTESGVHRHLWLKHRIRQQGEFAFEELLVLALFARRGLLLRLRRRFVLEAPAEPPGAHGMLRHAPAAVAPGRRRFSRFAVVLGGSFEEDSTMQCPGCFEIAISASEMCGECGFCVACCDCVREDADDDEDEDDETVEA